jgi:hypothetical protein
MKMRCVAYDHSELWRTRRCVPESGFLTTIQNMIDVAKLSAYLATLAKACSSPKGRLTM